MRYSQSDYCLNIANYATVCCLSDFAKGVKRQIMFQEQTFFSGGGAKIYGVI